jgi:hypothetical protein
MKGTKKEEKGVALQAGIGRIFAPSAVAEKEPRPDRLVSTSPRKTSKQHDNINR